MINSCKLLDLGSHGSPYTWNSRCHGGVDIRIKLDRTLANASWRTHFENAVVFIHLAVSSNHNPLLIDTDGGKSGGSQPFQFESMWLRHPKCKQIVSQAWSAPTVGPSTSTIICKSNRCKHALKCWNKVEFSNVQEKIKSLKSQLEKIQGLPPSDYNQNSESLISSLLEEELAKEEAL
ncbi:uncharacterized protein LOC122064021 [Macadamia integrifolia]|uniref:uncharacterized protein LOC122064021 n=1 Tax=Macadamia integrifolia TaxID=60698 RepID=UPI001C4F466C|nr:uncharacterized protein LOC122064021 [Macadamia integrifolia]